MSIPKLVCAFLETALNRYLTLDPEARQRLLPMHGRVIALELTGIGETLYLVPSPNRLQLLGSYEGSPDCLLRGTPLAFSGMGGQRASAERLFSGDVEISGDTELGHSFGRVMADIDIDWEEQLSRVTGDIIAHQVGNLWRGARAWSSDTGETLAMDIGEFLQQELRLLPVRAEIDQFLSAVDQLRDDSERLQARFERLRRRLESGTEPKP